MIQFTKAADITNHLLKLKEQGVSVGFVPTMGALHQGHISLINISKQNNAVTVCSIFVNPTQFNVKKDFDNYPTTIEKDIDLLQNAGCDILFFPNVPEIYPEDTGINSLYDLGYLETVLEGSHRPGHFQGVCNVVHRLLSIIPSNELYLGQKDYQQCMVIKKLVEQKNIKTKIIICPTIREKDGLAMSSRNLRLTTADRASAIKIFESLSFLKTNIKTGNLQELKNAAIKDLTVAGFKVDYVEIANAENLELIERWDGKTKLVALIAAFKGDVRLIDNMLFNA
jgi:pantoate--beta-alanine ligase